MLHLLMDFQQVKYFVTAAKCLNFSRAAERLYITQPALSRQINSIEKELNIQLFIRKGHELKLTPAAKALLTEFSQIYDLYEAAVERANSIQYGITGTLRIGVLDGTRVDDILPEMLDGFTSEYPEIDTELQYMNQNDLLNNLYDDTLDVSFTLQSEIKDRKNIAYTRLSESCNHIAVSSAHPLAAQGFVSLADLENETFIMLNPSISETGANLILEYFDACNCRPNIKYTPSLSTSALLVQAGLGVAMFDSRSVFRTLPNIKFLDTDQISDPSLVAAWRRDNKNVAFLTFSRMNGLFQT